LRLDHGEIVLAADACYFCQTLRERRLPRNMYDRGAMLASLDRLAALERSGLASFSAMTPSSSKRYRRRRSRSHNTDAESCAPSKLIRPTPHLISFLNRVIRSRWRDWVLTDNNLLIGTLFRRYLD
jgi:hypothetical protein